MKIESKVCHLLSGLFLCGVSWPVHSALYFSGDVHNLQSNNTSQVAITLEESDGQHYRAIGIFDNITLFGRFNMPGERVACPTGEVGLCLSFRGEMELGDDDSGFPELTRTGFSIQLRLAGDSSQGSYLIAPIIPYMLKEQPGELTLHPSSSELINAQADERVRREPERAKVYWDRGIARELQHDYVRAEQDFRHYASQLPDDARGAAKIGRMLLLQGKYKEASHWADKAARMDATHSQWQVLLGHVALMQGNAGQAGKFYQQAVKLMTSRRALDESLLHDLKWFAASGRHSADAEAAIDTAEQAFAKSAGAPLGEADIADYQGRYGDAIPLYREALLRAEAALGRDHLMVGRIQFKLANNLIRSGLYQEALQGYERSLKIIRSHKESSDYDIVNIELGEANLLETLGQPELAERFYRAAVRDSRVSRVILASDRAANLVMLAKFLNRNGRKQEALSLYKEAIPVLVGLMGPDHPGMAPYYNEVALLNSEMEAHDEAIRYMEKAQSIDSAYYGEDNLNQATLLGNLGNEYLAKQDFVRANDYMLRALKIATAWQNSEAMLYAFASLSQLMHEQNRNDEAIVFGKLAINEMQHMRRANAGLDKALQQSFLKKNEAYYKNLADLLTDAGRIAEAQQVLAMLKEDEYFDFIQRNSQEGGLDQRASYNGVEAPWAARFQQIGGQLGQLGKEIAELRKQSEKRSLSKDEQARLDGLEKDLEVAGQAFDAAMNGMLASLKEDAARDDASRKIDEGGSRQELLADLGQHTVLLQYLPLQDKLSIIVTTPTVRIARFASIAEKDLNQKITAYRELLQNPKRDPAPLARELYGYLIKPIEADLKQAGAQQLMLSLNGALRYLPFAALNDGQHYLLESYALSLYNEAAADKLDKANAQGWKVWGLGVTKAHENFSALGSVNAELRGIVGQGGISGETRLDELFTEQTLKDGVREHFPVLHIASHFKFTPGTMSDSFLLLGDGSHLTLQDVKAKLDFKGVDLITLSACETAFGGGRDANGREVEGMGAIMQKKGAKSVMATLWPVADSSTAKLMQDFYRLRDQQHLNKAQALRRAQLALLAGTLGGPTTTSERGANRAGGSEQSFTPDSKAPFAHPYYWAPFILMGNWL